MHFNKYYVSPLCFVLLIFAFFFNIIEEIIILFLLCFIHEIGHALIGIIFKCKINKISLNVCGFSLDIKDIEYKKWYQQIIFYLAGPLTYFISLIILFSLYKTNLINEYKYHVYLQNNLSLALFNLLPLYPLDGGRILDTINRLFFPVKECYKKRKIYIVITFIPTLFLLIYSQQIVLLLILCIVFILDIFFPDDNYNIYLNKRLLHNFSFPEKISFDKEIYHFYDNYYLENGQKINEKEMIPLFILKEKRFKKYN